MLALEILVLWLLLPQPRWRPPRATLVAVAVAAHDWNTAVTQSFRWCRSAIAVLLRVL